MSDRNILSRMYTTPMTAVYQPELSSVMFKHGGITVDVTKIAAIPATSRATLDDGSCIPGGLKYLRYGQVMTRINASGKYGPYDNTATDGRQTLTRGQAFILYHSHVWHSTEQSDCVGAFDGGPAIKSHLIITTGAASLADGPTVSDFENAFPMVRYAAQ